MLIISKNVVLRGYFKVDRRHGMASVKSNRLEGDLVFNKADRSVTSDTQIPTHKNSVLKLLKIKKRVKNLANVKDLKHHGKKNNSKWLKRIIEMKR